MINGIVKYDMWSELNNNMRCFEINDDRLWDWSNNELNNNMRCFEIRKQVTKNLQVVVKQ